MIEPPAPCADAKSARPAAPGKDHFGTCTRLWAYAVKVLHLQPERALDIPLCQLLVPASASEALAGKIPAGKDYYEISRSLPPPRVHPIATQSDGDQMHQAGQEKDAKKNAHNGNLA